MSYSQDPDNWSRLGDIRLCPLTDNEEKSLALLKRKGNRCKNYNCDGICQGDDLYCTLCRAEFSEILSFSGNDVNEALQYSSASINSGSQGSQPNSVRSLFQEEPVEKPEVGSIHDSRQISTTSPEDPKCVGPLCRSSSAINSDGLCESCHNILRDANTKLYYCKFHLIVY